MDQEKYSWVSTVVELTPEMNRLLTQASSRSRRSKTQEASVRLFDHLMHFQDIATEGKRFHSVDKN